MELRQVIRETTSRHLDAGYSVMGQCLTAVGWVGNTLPERYDMTELPCSDIAGPGFAVGHALAGKRPILITRYQGFQWYGAGPVVNYACKSKEMWDVPCPMLIRSIAMEGAIGPVAGSSHHSLFYRMPGIKIYSPMTPDEWRIAYDDFMGGTDVVYLSEHRKAWDQKVETPCISNDVADVVLFPISITRFAAFDAATELAKCGYKVAVYPIWKLKPLSLPTRAYHDLRRSLRGGIVLDDDYENGVGKLIAHDLSQRTHSPIMVKGLEEKTAGFYKDNLPPTKEQIIKWATF